MITDLLKTTKNCQRQSNKFKQSCPSIDKKGFILQDEISNDWKYLDQTQVLIFHSWIAEYAKVKSVIDLGDGRKKLMFQKNLKHAPIGQWNKAGGWRFILLNNLALLDVPGTWLFLGKYLSIDFSKIHIISCEKFLANFLISISRSVIKTAMYISGEYVCVEDNGKALFSYIPPEDAGNDNQLIGSNLEQMIVINKANNIKFQGLKFQHTSQGGKDGYRWGTEAAIRIFNR